MTLFTIGYEGMLLQQFFAVLAANRVQTIVDVRELPISRRPGFAKAALASGAAKRGLSYVHIVALGCPRNIRHDYRDDKDWSRYTRRFLSYLDGQNAAIDELASLIRRERCCLLCFEADPATCHRSFVAERVAARTRQHLSIVHLTAPTPEVIGRLHPALA
jgi:uncharacterized protein (DUF488 family)